MYGPTHCQSIQQIPLQGIGTSQPVATFRSPCKSSNFLSTDKGPTARIRGHSYGIHQGKTHINYMSGEYHSAQDWPRQFPRYCTGKGFGNGLTEVTFEPNTFNIWLKGGLIHHTPILSCLHLNTWQIGYNKHVSIIYTWKQIKVDGTHGLQTSLQPKLPPQNKQRWWYGNASEATNTYKTMPGWWTNGLWAQETCTMVLLTSQAHIQKTPKYAWNQQLKASWNSFAYQRQVDALPKHPTTLFCNCHCWISSWRQTYTQWPSTKGLGRDLSVPTKYGPYGLLTDTSPPMPKYVSPDSYPFTRRD